MPKSKNSSSEKKAVRGITTRVRAALENTARQLQLSADGLPIASGEKPINVVVAFSGGLDSSVLLYAASQLKGKSYGEITAVHVHHGLSKHANEWAEFCAERARKYGVNFVLRKVTVPSGGAGFEAEARQLRYAVLEEEAKKAQESARALFTGGNAAEMPTSELTEADFVDGKIDILGVLVKSGLSASRSEARRAVEQGGVVVADEKVTDVKTTYAPEQFDGEGLVVRRGKKNFKRVVMSK